MKMEMKSNKILKLNLLKLKKMIKMIRNININININIKEIK